MALSTPSYTNINWSSVTKAGVFSFVSGFLAALSAQGGFSIGLGWEGTISLLSGALVSGINVALFTVYQAFSTE